MLNHVKVLAEEIGPRGSCTAEEKKAADYIKNELSAMGLLPQLESFKAVTSFSWAFIGIYLLFVVAAVAFPFRPALGFAFALLGLVAFYFESNTFPFFSRFIPKKPSQNVVATIPARSKTLRKVVVMAHYDSSRSAWNFSPQMVKNFRLSYLLMTGAMVLMTVLYALGTWSPISPFLLWLLSLPPAVYLFITLLSLVHRELKGVYTPGANDNASGVAVLLEVAKILKKHPPLTTRVTLVATGAEESGTNGVLAFLSRHRPAKDTFFINLDNLGIGRTAVITREGILGGKPASPELLFLARQVCREKKIEASFRPYSLLTTDGTATLFRGYRTVSIMAFDEKGLLPHWHWPTDRAEHVRAENLETAKELVMGLIRGIES